MRAQHLSNFHRLRNVNVMEIPTFCIMAKEWFKLISLALLTEDRWKGTRNV